MPDVTVQAGEVSSGRIALTAGEVSTVTFTDNLAAVRIINTDGAAVYFSFDGSTPTVDGKKTYEVPAGSVAELPTPGSTEVIKLISAGTPSVRVERA